jgi:hypothetical protein
MGRDGGGETVGDEIVDGWREREKEWRDWKENKLYNLITSNSYSCMTASLMLSSVCPQQSLHRISIASRNNSRK